LGGSLSGSTWIYRGASNNTYGPYAATIGAFSQTGDAGGNSTQQAHRVHIPVMGRCYYYDWNITLDATSVTRTPVIATVNPGPTPITGCQQYARQALLLLLYTHRRNVVKQRYGIATVGSTTGIVTGVTPVYLPSPTI